MGFIDSIESGASDVFGTIKSDADKVVTAIANTPKELGNIVDNVVQTGGKIANNVVNKASGVISGAEDVLLLPLLAIGVGIAFLFYNSSSNTISNVAESASKVAPLAV